MNFIREHKIFFLVTVLFLLLSVFLYYNWIEKEKEKVAIQEEVDKIKKDLTTLLTFDYKLNNENVELSKNNVEIANKFYIKFKKKIVENYKIPFPDEHLIKKRPVDVKRSITIWNKKAITNLKNRGVDISQGITFDKYTKKDSPPPQIQEINLLYKHLSIVDFLLKTFYESGILQISNFSRPRGLNFLETKHYRSSRYVVDLKGQVSNLKRVLNILSSSNDFFILTKKVQLESKVTLSPVSSESNNDDEILKEVKIGQRINPFNLSEIKLQLVFDVYEFKEK